MLQLCDKKNLSHPDDWRQAEFAQLFRFLQRPLPLQLRQLVDDLLSPDLQLWLWDNYGWSKPRD